MRFFSRLTLSIWGALCCLGVAVAPADTYPKNPAVDVEHYRFELELAEGQTEIRGRATIEARFLEAGQQRWSLDLVNPDPATGLGMQVDAVTIRSGKEMAAVRSQHLNNRLEIFFDRAPARNEKVEVEIEYHGSPADGLGGEPNVHGTWSWFSDNWPNKARHWLPVVDHPYDKATSEMVIVAPSIYQVVSNGLLREETDLEGGRRRTHWRQSVPVATWLYTLGVTRFAVQELAPFDGKPVQTWVFAQDRDAGFHDFAVPTHHVLEFYSDKVGPYSYEKLANIQSNRVRGGMEAASAIMYDARSVTGERTDRWRNVVIHEIAHQWFGNAVTEHDWNDVWLSEGFATYFTLLFIEHAYGRDEFVKGLLESRQKIFEFYDKEPDYRIIHQNLDDMTKVTTGNTYQKGAWTLHMLRSLIGDKPFWRGIREYYALYQDRNSTTEDFIRVMQEASSQQLDWFFDQWLRQGSALVLGWQWSFDQGVVTLVFEQQQPEEAVFRAPVEIELRFADGESSRSTVWIDGRRSSATIEVAAPPSEVVIDPDVELLFRPSP